VNRNTAVQLSTRYTDPERHITHRKTDRQTTISSQEPIILRAAVRSAKMIFNFKLVISNMRVVTFYTTYESLYRVTYGACLFTEIIMLVTERSFFSVCRL